MADEQLREVITDDVSYRKDITDDVRYVGGVDLAVGEDLTVTINVSEAIKGLKAVQREAKKATAALKELEEQQEKMNTPVSFYGGNTYVTDELNIGKIAKELHKQMQRAKAKVVSI